MNPAPAPAQLAFVSNLFTSKIFLAQVVTLVATVLNAMGYRFLDDPAAQQQLITVLDLIVTALLRWLASGNPVALAGPVNAPANRDVPVGASVVTVQAPQEPTVAQAVQPLTAGEHSVTVLPPAIGAQATPSNVIVQKKVV